jgi:hypothetical protein
MSLALRVTGGILMLAAELCVVLVLFGADTILWMIAAVVLMAVGVFAWRRGWQLRS